MFLVPKVLQQCCESTIKLPEILPFKVSLNISNYFQYLVPLGISLRENTGKGSPFNKNEWWEKSFSILNDEKSFFSPQNFPFPTAREIVFPFL